MAEPLRGYGLSWHWHGLAMFGHDRWFCHGVAIVCHGRAMVLSECSCSRQATSPRQPPNQRLQRLCIDAWAAEADIQKQSQGRISFSIGESKSLSGGRVA